MLSKNEIKYLISLKLKEYREKKKKFLIEGFHLLEECLNSPYEINIIIVRDDIDVGKNSNLQPALKQKKVRIETVPEKIFNKLSETKNPQGIIAVVNKEHGSVPHQNTMSGPVIALDRITDPGNLGTIIRTAYWFNVKTVIVGIGSVDIYNSKVLRSSQGAFFHINILYNVNLAEELSSIQYKEYRVLLFTPNAETSLTQLNGSDEYILVFGNESGGISRALLESNFQKIKIDRFSPCESLNVAVACGIALYNLQTPGHPPFLQKGGLRGLIGKQS